MTSALIAILVIVGWSFVAGGLSRVRISGALLMVITGMVIGLTTSNPIGYALDTDDAEPAVELILALLLFVDAIEVRGGYFAGERRTSFRLLLIAMPLSIAPATLLGLALLPTMSVGVALAIACVVIPMDLTPVSSLVRDQRIPSRVRHLLNIESGYNDGIIAPVFIFALTLAGDHKHASSPADALEQAVPSALWAALAGSVIGFVAARLTNISARRGLATEQSIRISLVLIPILAYGCSVQLGGNGFVAAFICGIAYKAAREDGPGDEQLRLVDDVSGLAALTMWFVFGCAAVLVFELGFVWQLVVLGIAALTVLRIVPVYLALLRTDLGRRDRLLVGVLGPRGTASIVFGQLAFNELDGLVADQTLYAMTVTVLASVLFHGFGAALIAHRLGRRNPAPELKSD
ncbi:cation:proton antiporter [Gordonia amicalis]|uniref:cation:proton antiporter n=1 Tax=Gordonia amicalis TaxID=89053 RepID=UPI0015F77B6D|nr:cation:proton antiporter [Gordonia amicalis]MBA5847388.1 cation:proton antiporter [Gordonia amicalis]